MLLGNMCNQFINDNQIGLGKVFLLKQLTCLHFCLDPSCRCMLQDEYILNGSIRFIMLQHLQHSSKQLSNICLNLVLCSVNLR